MNKNPRHPTMNTRTAATLLLLAFSAFQPFSHSTLFSAPPGRIAAPAQRLLARVLPQGRADAFAVEPIPAAANGLDVFEIESVNNKIVLRGNSPVAVASALRWYLKYYAHCQLSWCGDNLDLPSPPAPLPPVPQKVRETTPYEWRVNFNYCTFNYTMSWWDWKRWEREIDFMAMNGVNMPLAITGQEAVWQNTLRRFKMSDDEIRAFLCGPAFFAWQFMANLEGWGGPLPQQWIDRNTALARKILARERELGMTPILQGFTGFVPREIKNKYPGASIQVKPNWARVFPGAAQLDPLDPLFAPMGRAFIEEQTKLYGTDHWYAADPFHESAPPSDAPGYLARVASAILDTMKSADPGAKIAMQSWSIRQEIVAQIPEERLLILHLIGGWGADTAPAGVSGGKITSFAGRKWVNGLVQDYGGRNFLCGNIKDVLQRPELLEKQAERNMAGIGLFPEGIELTPAVFEAACDLAWMREPAALQPWLRDYTLARYGTRNPNADEAWKILGDTVYSAGYGARFECGSAESTICARPALDITHAANNADMRRNYNAIALWAACEKMLAAAPALAAKDTYRYDLVDLARQCLADLSLPLQHDITAAYNSGDPAALKKAGALFLELAADMDRLLATRREFLLGKWLADARACGETPAQKALYERNARLLITVWGPPEAGAQLFDYSNRQWSGLIAGYYIPRWKKFLAHLEAQPASGPARFTSASIAKKLINKRPGNDANDFYRALAQWEYAWCDGAEKYPSTPSGDSVTIAAELYEKWRPLVEKAYERYEPRTLKPAAAPQ